ncbi:tripartite tricarboxylate transporter substrate-binding protein [Brackiella oedipodis]|uniref:tripartite tricarboxylate transporter substrate-binding protein n=1 Tax=Brackiella oedipodis TaxID=124225 RepID=UPI00048C06D1|nr:tripartite tricarboxylate transporter substrate-binding protein [Brackiella oedipodis]
MKSKTKRAFARQLLVIVQTTLLCMVFSPFALAQGTTSWPEKDLQILVPNQLGSNADQIARIVAIRMSKNVDQRIKIKNFSTLNFADYQAQIKAQNDGYTLAILPTYMMREQIGLKQAAKLSQDVHYLALAARQPMLIVTLAKAKPHDAQDWQSLLHAKHKKLTAACPTQGKEALLLESLEKAQGKGFTCVSVDTPEQALEKLLGKQVDFAVSNTAIAMPLINGHELQLLALSTESGLTHFKDTPSLAQLGLDQLPKLDDYVFVISQEVPEQLQQRIQKELLNALHDPTVKYILKQQLIEPLGDQVEWQALERSVYD